MLAPLRSLLLSLIDYAGLFPPAQLSLLQAMATYEHGQTSANAWMLNRFVLPIAQLPELVAYLPQFSLQQWTLSLILSERAEADLEQLSVWHHPSVAIAALEFPVMSTDSIKRLLPDLPTGVEAFFELPWQTETANPDWAADLAVLRGTGASVKIRTGGVTAAAFPTADQLCQFVHTCAADQSAIAPISLKATAGLHHPLPGSYPLTYEPNSPTAPMLGFLNLAVLAALLYHHKLTVAAGVRLLQTSSFAAFQVTDTELIWDNHSLSLAEIETARQRFFRSVGSCSFHEPIHELNQLKLL